MTKKPQSRKNKSPHSGWIDDEIITELQKIKTDQKLTIQHQIEIGVWQTLEKHSKLSPKKMQQFKELLNIKNEDT